jgi:mannose-6-phosphate isomerase-like protein (cupin superfamily)
MEKINISEKLRTFDKYWQSKQVTDFNSQSVKLVKLKGEFEWHHHKAEDEFYLVLKGQLNVELEDESVVLDEGDLFVVPRNRGHRLLAAQEVHLMIIEPKSTLHGETVKKELEKPGTEPAES